MVKEGTIHRLMYMINDCFTRMEVSFSSAELESLVLMLYRAMMRKGRHFHSISHVFNLAEPDRAAFSLAALFHDQVYYQVDEGFTPDVLKVISPYIDEVSESRGGDGKIFLKKYLPPEDDGLQLNLMLFGFTPGMELSPFGGLNEFLSSLMMTKHLEPMVSIKDLLKMAACVEATIPFRGMNEKGRSHFEELAQRVKTAEEQLGLNLTEAEMDGIIKEAVFFANKDVHNFSEEDPRDFLDNTWALIPETNMSLRDNDIYTIRNYREALQKMEGFFSFLDPGNVFHQYKDVPSNKELNRLKEGAAKNIATARDYLKIKLFTIAILEALAEVTGGDTPISLFMGDLPEEGETVNRLEDYLPGHDSPYSIDPQSPVYQLLDKGRKTESRFDIKNAPLSLFVYKNTDPLKMDFFFEESKKMFRKEIEHEAFLKELPEGLLSAIAKASARMVFTRKDTLLRFA